MKRISWRIKGASRPASVLKMAPAGDPSITETPEYRIVVLFMVFVAITLVFEKSSEWVDHYLKKHNRRGLLHTIHKLEEEILALGLISLLLIVFEEYIIQICISSDNDEKKGKEKKKSSDKKGAAGEEKDDSEADALTAELEGTEVSGDTLTAGENGDEAPLVDASLTDGDGGNRRLLGTMMRMLLAGGGGESVCPEGDESFWSIRTLHETHIFIFVLAAVHIVYSGTSVVLCSWKVNQWKQWEEQRHNDLTRIDISHLSASRNPIVHYWRAFWSQFHQHIDPSVYLSLRRLFIERMELDADFEFHKFLVNTMEEEFSKVVKLEWSMWALAAIWIITDASVVYVMTGLGLVLILVAGMKLESITMRLGNEAYLMYADKPPRGAKKSGNMVVRNLARISNGITHLLAGSPSANKQTGGAHSTVESVNSQQTNATSIDIMQGAAMGPDGYGNVEGSTRGEHGMSGMCFGCCGSSEPANDGGLKRADTFSHTYKVCDSAHLFPFQRPRWMLRLFQFIYFETSLIMAVLLFNVWQDVDPDFILSPDWVAYVEVGLGVITMLITSILLLPVYWLTMVVGSHCPDKVLKKAKKKNISPQLVNALETTSVNIARQSMNRTSVGMNKKAAAGMTHSGSNPTIAGEQTRSTYPTHWADLENVPEVHMTRETAAPAQAAEEEHKAPKDALGMLVGAMLKTKQRELENLTTDGAADNQQQDNGVNEVNGGNPSLERKSKPLLKRLSVPLVSLPAAKEPKKSKGQQGQQGQQVAESRSADYYGAGTSAGTGAGDVPATGLMRKSKSEQDLAEGGPPSLARGSLPSSEVVDRKRTAYLAQERHNAEHMMMESPEEEEETPRLITGRLDPSGSWLKASGPKAGEKRTGGGAPGVRDLSGAKDEATRVFSSRPNPGPPKHAGQRGVLDHVAELYKLGEKQKHQRE